MWGVDWASLHGSECSERGSGVGFCEYDSKLKCYMKSKEFFYR
jgi:hypothetical protein